MPRIEKTVFLSYRRADQALALLVFKALTQHGYDVFIDYDGIASGDFESVILENIGARAHFLVLLTPTALDRCDEPDDWLRREIEAAIEARRNVVPLLMTGFDFASPAVARHLTGSLAALRKYNGLPVHLTYFDAAIERLCSKHLAVPLQSVLHPASPAAVQVARAQQAAASEAPDRDPVLRAAPPAPAPPPVFGLLDYRNNQVVLAAGVLTLIAIAVLLTNALQPEPEAPPAAIAASAPPPASTPAPAGPSPSDAAAQYQRGNDYFDGRNGVVQSDAEAAAWYRKAAEQGHAPAQARLGFMFDSGRGVTQSDVEAVAWYRKAAERGNASGQSNLGVMYGTGRGVAQSDVEAVAWYRKAAEQGNASAQTNMGVMYQNGRGVVQSDVEAVKWYAKAAAQGGSAAQAYLGAMYENGKGGLAKDMPQALQLYRKAAAQGDSFAKAALKRLGG